MFERNFKVIKGGIDTPSGIDRRSFVSAFATNTRLMGVFGMYIEWEVESYGVPSSLHQFFYFDAEEYGFESYTELTNANPEELEKTERSIMGGLGGSRIDLNEREARFIVQYYIAFNEEHGLELPDPYSSYAFLDTQAIDMTQEEKDAVFKKLCVTVSGPFEAINYYLMRLFAHDDYAAGFLTSADFFGGEHGLESPVSLCKNTINITKSSIGETSYICESLLDDEVTKQYTMLISELTVTKTFEISSFHVLSSFSISSVEAAMQLLHSEFITLYNITFDTQLFEEKCGRLLETAVASSYESGTLYMIFNKDNRHVKNKIFNLNGDIASMLFFPASGGRLIVCANSIGAIIGIENSLAGSLLGCAITPTAKYEFKDPVFYDYINSDFDDFEEFVRNLQFEPE